MDQKGIDRINELARKAKTQELTPEGKKKSSINFEKNSSQAYV